MRSKMVSAAHWMSASQGSSRGMPIAGDLILDSAPNAESPPIIGGFRLSDRTIGMAIFHLVVTRTGPSWRAGRPLEEQSGWAEHAAFMDELVDRGFIILGGPLADEHRVVHVV